jgi:hypothetical protein
LSCDNAPSTKSLSTGSVANENSSFNSITPNKYSWPTTIMSEESRIYANCLPAEWTLPTSSSPADYNLTTWMPQNGKHLPSSSEVNRYSSFTNSEHNEISLPTIIRATGSQSHVPKEAVDCGYERDRITFVVRDCDANWDSK